MEFMLGTINLEAIRKYQKILPLAGITFNPSIVKQAGKTDSFAQMEEIKKKIGQANLYVRVVGQVTEEILGDAQIIVQQLGQGTFIKILASKAGLAVTKQLKQANYRITATVTYTGFQSYLAIVAGVDYLTLYYNRMENLTIDPQGVIEYSTTGIKRMNIKSKILAASSKNVAQINQACQMGTQAVTITPELMTQGLAMPVTQKVVTDFQEDWAAAFGVETVNELT